MHRYNINVGKVFGGFYYGWTKALGHVLVVLLLALGGGCGSDSPASGDTAGGDGAEAQPADSAADQTSGGDGMTQLDVAPGDGSLLDTKAAPDTITGADVLCGTTELCNGKDDDCDGATDEEAPCDDGDACTVGDSCTSGACVAGKAEDCSSVNPCVKGVCDPTKGCVGSALTGPCDDGSACTKNDVCLNAFCTGEGINCDDGVVCTNDGCDVVKGCLHEVMADDTPCGSKKVCVAGKCVPSGSMYAHTSSQLYKLDLSTKSFALVGKFTFDKSSGSVTDIALNRTQTLYAVTFNNLFTCKTNTAACSWLMTLPTSFNGMTFIPMGTLYKDKEALIGIANNGGWHLVDYMAAKPTLKLLGSYGPGYSSSGDAFSVLGIGTFATVKKSGVGGDVLVEVNPKTGKVIKDLSAIGASNLYGFAWWDGVFYGFASSGQVWDIDVATGKGKQLTGFNIPKVSWWGAGVSTEAGF